MFRLLPLFALVACESGLSVRADVTVPDDIAHYYDEASPGILRLAIGQIVLDVEPMCGDTFPDPVEVYFDFGFGCLDEREGAEEALVAWIEPMPGSWDDAAFCAASRGSGNTLDLSEFPEATLATAPDAAWPQGEAAAPWKRDFSPCGGHAEGSVVIE